MAGEDETGLRPVPADEIRRQPGGLTPCGQDAEDPSGRPDGVRGEAQPVREGILLGLMALGDLGADAPAEGEVVFQAIKHLRSRAIQFRSQETSHQGDVIAPGDNVVEQHIAMRRKNPALRQVEHVLGRELRVVISGEQSGRDAARGEKRRGLGRELGGVLRTRAGAGVERVAVENEAVDAVQQRAELGEALHAAGVVAVVYVGKDADERAGHKKGVASMAEAGPGNNRKDACAGACRGAATLRAFGMRGWCLFLTWLVACAVVRADQAADIAKIHFEVLGGKERIEALTAMRASGFVLAGGKKLRFTLIAARPNKVRIETGAEGRSLVQVSDGVEPPWKYDTGVWPPKYVVMADADAKLLAADAEFDDPLVAGEARGFTFDYAGEVRAGEKKNYLRVLVTRKLIETFSILIDPETYFIVARVEERKSPGGRRVEIVTRYDDYRPVDSVLVPHKVTMVVDGKITQQTVIEAIEPNPTITEETFSRPKVSLPRKK